jgi:hypothetical protein
MINLQSYDQWILESSGETFKPRRGTPLQFDHKKHPELAGEMFNLISIAYSEIGGHAKIKSPEDVFSDPDWNFWEGIDIHGSQDFDIIMFGQKTRYGIKFSGVGHDGSGDAKKEYLNDIGKDLKNLGFYLEASGKLSEILINKYGCPTVKSEDEVVKVLGKQVKWIGELKGSSGDGWYIRNIGGHPHEKILLGRPKS